MIDLGCGTTRQELHLLKQVAKVALQQFDLASAHIRLLRHGCNTTYRIEAVDGQSFALHIFRFFDESIDVTERTRWIESELWWLGHLRRHVDVSVPKPARARSRKGSASVVRVDDFRTALNCALFHWMPGRFQRRTLRPQHLRRVGRLTANLHTDSSRLTVPEGFLRGRVDAVDDETQAKAVRLFREEHSRGAAVLVERAMVRVRQTQEQLGEHPEVFGLIHADIHQSNYLFNDREVALIDFGDCGWGHYLYDLAVTLNELSGQPDLPNLRKALFEGYREVRELSKEHEALVEDFRLLRCVQDIAWFLRLRNALSQAALAARVEPQLQGLQQSMEAR